MAVTIPRLNPIQTAAPGSAGRLEVSAPNLLGATAPLREGLSAGLGDVADAYKELRKKELETKSLKATEYATKYEQSAKLSLDKKSLLKGDPTQAYKEFDEELVNLEKSVYEQVGEDPETQYFLREKIIKANGRISDTRNTNQTKQYYGWQKEVADSSVKLRQDNVAKNSQYLDVRNQMTFGSVQSQIDEIEGTRIAIAIQNGYDIKQVDEERTDPITGQKYRYKGWDYSNAPAVESQIKADIGDAIIPTVKSLNAAGKIAEAKQLIKDQGRWLNAADLAKLTSDNDEANVKTQALALTANLKNKSGKAALDEIATSSVSDDIKFKAREIIDTRDRQDANALERKRKDGERFLYTFVDERQNSKKPFATVAELKDSPEYKNVKDVLSPSALKAIEQRIEAPTVSDPKSLDAMSASYRKGFVNNEGKPLTDAEFNNLLSGLKQEDRNRYRRLRETVTKPPKGLTESQMRSRMDALNSYMMADARLSGVIPKAGSMDKWDDTDRKYWTETLQPAWVDYYTKNAEQLPSEPTAQQKWVRDFIRNFTADPENAPPRKSFLGFSFDGRTTRQLPELSARAQFQNSPTDGRSTTTGPKSVTKPAPKDAKPADKSVDLNTMSREQIAQWEAEYIKETGASGAPDYEEFQAWINKKVRK